MFKLSLLVAAAALRRPLAFLGRSEPYLIEFYGRNAEEDVRKMAPLRRKVERKLGTKFLRFDIFTDAEAYRLMMLLDKTCDGKTICGGLPYYYNRKTGTSICGATSLEQLENWATGQKHALSTFSPLSQRQVAAQQRVISPAQRRFRLEIESGKKWIDEAIGRKVTEEIKNIKLPPPTTVSTAAWGG